MLRTNYLRQKLSNGDCTLGTWNIIPSPFVVDIIASAGLDFIIIDSEYGSMSFETAQTMVAVCESYGVSPIMRVGKLDESLVLKALDIGMHGIQIPNVSSVDDARLLVNYAKYPPQGQRGFSPYVRAGLYNVENGPILPHKGNENTLVIVNLEGPDSLSNIEEIASVNGIDIIFIGVFDLSKTLGVPGEIQHPKVMESLDAAISKVHKIGKKVGTIASNKSMFKILKSKRVDYLTYSVDSGVLREGYTKLLKE